MASCDSTATKSQMNSDRRSINHDKIIDEITSQVINAYLFKFSQDRDGTRVDNLRPRRQLGALFSRSFLFASYLIPWVKSLLFGHGHQRHQMSSKVLF
jgi:hypothetical protein